MFVVGTPSAGFLPARKHKFTYVSDVVSIDVPVRGVFPQDAQRPGALFDICPDPGTVLFGALLEVLFAFSKYPSLEDGQFFIIHAVQVDGDRLTVVGRAVEYVKG